jgi:hypothetical protein
MALQARRGGKEWGPGASTGTSSCKTTQAGPSSRVQRDNADVLPSVAPQLLAQSWLTNWWLAS